MIRQLLNTSLLKYRTLYSALQPGCIWTKCFLLLAWISSCSKLHFSNVNGKSRWRFYSPKMAISDATGRFPWCSCSAVWKLNATQYRFSVFIRILRPGAILDRKFGKNRQYTLFFKIKLYNKNSSTESTSQSQFSVLFRVNI
jgi:hypothetical protein